MAPKEVARTAAEWIMEHIRFLVKMHIGCDWRGFWCIEAIAVNLIVIDSELELRNLKDDPVSLQ